ncbi:MAG: DotD/TraH family lipoprotein [Gammaproteobacteria bacterium]|nr:DotD/TraH family lipoprotein [Gammaproteobacteria bacterium]
MLKRLAWLSYSLITVSILAVSGCSSKPNAAPALPDNSALIQQDLSAAAVSATGSLSQLAAIEKARYQSEAYMPFANVHDQALDTFVSIQWYGPIAPLLQQVADMIGYKLQVFGKPPTTPILVNIDDTQQKTSAINIIRNADLQAGANANILIFTDQKLISLRYTGS